jgi:oligopeptide transport system ATP-binding protein
MSEVILEVKNLKTYFRTGGADVKAVDDVSFTLRQGETLGIVGESGSGKSVTSMSIMRLIPWPPGKIVGGQILFKGKDIVSMSDDEIRKLRGNKVSMIFQDPMTSLNPYLRISKQIGEVLELHQGMSSKQARNEAIKLLEMVGIPDPSGRVDQYPHQFSGGMRQRVMIAMALACKPELLIADEPTTALDVTIQAQILELIKNLQKDLKTAVILITHDLGVVAGMADNLAVMYAGKVVEYGPSRSVFKTPKHPYTQGLLRSVPRLDSKGTLTPIRGLPPNLALLDQGCAFRPRCDYKHERCEQYPSNTQISESHKAACWLLDQK